jgi:exodeoxyribonuclease VII small subunit
MEKLSFEEALTRLEEIVEQLEGGKLELETSLKLFEEGIKLSQYCQKQLQKAEGKIKNLVKNLDGTLELVDWEGE